MFLSSRFCAAAAFSALAAFAYPAGAAETAPPLVQGSATAEVSLAYFEQRLTPFGHWFQHPVWGEVWQPNTGPTFRPYFYGYWQYTADYGWLWVSNEPYGDIVYHYGRWMFDPNYGWLWVPGYVWGPGWVAWRETGSYSGYVGWFPLPPASEDFSLNAPAPLYRPEDLYGYRNFYANNFGPDAFSGLWVFMPVQDFGDKDRRPYVIDRARLRDLYRDSHDRTNYVRDREHDRILDRSIDKDEVERSTRRSFGAPQSSQFLRRDVPIVSLSRGQELSRRNRDANVGLAGAVTPSQGRSVPGENNLNGDRGAQARFGPRADRYAPNHAVAQAPSPKPGVAPNLSPNPHPANDQRRADRERREQGEFPRGDTGNPSTEFPRAARTSRFPDDDSKTPRQAIPEGLVPGTVRNRARNGGFIPLRPPALAQAPIVQPAGLPHGPAAPQPAIPRAVTPQQPQHEDAQAGHEGLRRFP